MRTAHGTNEDRWLASETLKNTVFLTSGLERKENEIFQNRVNIFFFVFVRGCVQKTLYKYLGFGCPVQKNS